MIFCQINLSIIINADIEFTEHYPYMKENNKNNLFFLVIPFIVVIFVSIGFKDSVIYSSKRINENNYFETKAGEIKNAGKYNILSSEDLSSNIKDTVFTTKDNWLELKINEQTLYQHWRDGRTVKYPVSTGNNKGGDPEALESRPGLFAIFHKEEHHKSSQFNASNMYHFMPFNQGIGFHSIDGTAYYNHLGKRPSSHGCIRMKHSDAEKLFEDSPKGTFVLATNGYSARTVAFAPKDFVNSREYDKEDFKVMMASNLYNIMNGKYYLEEREMFVIDPKVIPVSGIYISYDVEIPENQIIPRSYLAFYEPKDKVNLKSKSEILPDEYSEEMIKLVSNENSNMENLIPKNTVNSKSDLVKKYFNNPIGILPYFGPKR